MNAAFLILGVVGAYLLGAVPNGLLVARARGVDIRAVGSGNIGATNVFRSVGKGAGLAVLLLDMAKGFVPAWGFPLAAGLAGAEGAAGDAAPWGLVFGAAAIAGHTWPVYLGFRGGKGVATSAGVLCGVAPAAAGIAVLSWLVLVGLTRYVSVASIGAAVAVAVAGWLRYAEQGRAVPTVLTLLAALVIWRHRSNLRRLCAGTENRFTLSKPKES